MDADLENLHSSLQQVGLPSTIDELKNPTEEYVVKVIKTFLTMFSIDANLISKPSLEQQGVLWYREDCNITGLINLHVVMEEICKRTYTPQLCIFDITTPGQKKTRMFLKFLTNFIFYASNKQLEFQDRLEEIHKRAREFNNILQEKNEIQKETNDKLTHIGKLLFQKEKFEKEIKETIARTKANNKKLFELSKEVTGIKEKKEHVLEVYETLNAQAAESVKEIEELQSQIVKSPEKWKARLERLEEEYKLKLEERKTMLEAFQERKQLFEQRENILKFVKKQVDELPEKNDLYKQLKNITSKKEEVKQQLEELKSTAVKWKNDVALQKEHCTATEIELHDIETQCHQNRSELQNRRKQLFSQIKMKEARVAEEKQKFNEVYLEENSLKNCINKVEEDTAIFVRSCQKLYDSEIASEKEVWKTFRENDFI